MNISDAGSDALQWLDEHMIESLELPDEAFDWVFMLKESDWPLLESVWHDRPPKWREALAYILTEGPIYPSQRLLIRALFDADPYVAAEAAATLQRHRELEGDALAFSPAVLERIQQIVDNHGSPQR